MTEGKKALEFKHAHITGQTMRDHWGPIIDRIADETADWRDARIEALEAENERLRRVLARWQYSGCPNCSGDCGSANPPVTSCIMDETRAALGEKQ